MRSRLPALLRLPLLSWARLNPIAGLPKDNLGSQIAHRLQTPSQDRDRLTQGIHIPTDTEEALGRLENACQLCHQADSIVKTIKTASQAGKLPSGKPEQLIETALTAGIISLADVEIVRTAEIARTDAIQVDAFSIVGNPPNLRKVSQMAA